MQFDFSIIIPYLIGLAVLFFGYFFGLFEGRNQGYKRRKKEEDEEFRAKPKVEEPLPPPSPPVTKTENNLLRLSLEENDHLRLELDNQSVDTSHLTPDQRKRLIELMVSMRPWIEGKPSAVKPTPPPQPGPGPFSAQTPPSTPPTPQPGPALASAAPGISSEDEPSAPTSMVGQIDAILQAHLAATPLAGRGIRITESLKGGVIVMVGLDRYEAVGDVPDPQVQAAIKAAIAEWEKKFTPGSAI